MGFQHYGGKGFGANLRVDQTIQGMVEQDRVRLLPHQAGPVLQSQMADVIPQQIFHVARTREEKTGFRQAAHHLLGGFEKNPLPLADRKVESANHAKGHICFVEIQFSPGCGSESGLLGMEQGGIDSGVDDMEFGWINPASGAVMSLNHGRGGIIVAIAQDMGHETGDGNNRVGLRKEMTAAKGRTRTFCEMPRKNKKRSGLDESGSEQGCPVVVAMVSVENSGPSFFQQLGEGQNLQRAKTGQRMKRKKMGLWAKRSLLWSGDFNGPSPCGKTVGEGKALGIRASAPQAGVELENPAGEVRSGH